MELTPTEERIIRQLRTLQGQYDNFTLMLYGQGSIKRRVLDMAWTPRIRLSSVSVPVAVED